MARESAEYFCLINKITVYHIYSSHTGVQVQYSPVTTDSLITEYQTRSTGPCCVLLRTCTISIRYSKLAYNGISHITVNDLIPEMLLAVVLLSYAGHTGSVYKAHDMPMISSADTQLG